MELCLPFAYGSPLLTGPARGAGFFKIGFHRGQLSLALALAAFLTLKPEIVAQDPIFSVGLHKFVPY